MFTRQLACLAFSSLLVAPVALAQTPVALELGQSVSAELAGGQTHHYTVTANAGQFLRVNVLRPSITTTARLLDPSDQSKLVEVQWPGGAMEPDTLCWIARTAGEYRLEFAPESKTDLASKYEIKLEELRRTVPDDEKQIEVQNLIEEAQALSNKRDWKLAITAWERALLLVREVKDLVRVSVVLRNLVVAHDGAGQRPDAVKYLEQALLLSREIKNRAGEAASLRELGRIHAMLNQQQKALDYYNQALPLVRAVGDRTGEAKTLNNLGIVYRSLGEQQKALEYYNQALPLFRAVGDRTGEARILTNLGNVYSSLGEQQKALEYHNQALPLFRAVGDRTGETGVLHNLGNVYLSLGELQKALEYYNQALPIHRAVGDRTREAGILSNLGSVYSSLGEQQKALEYFNQALPLFRGVGDRTDEAGILNNLGNVYKFLGEQQKALEYYNQALPIHRAVGDRTGEARVLNNLGNVYKFLGEQQKALEYYNQALPIHRAVGDPTTEAKTLNNLGNVYSSLGEQQKALEYYNQALPIHRAVGDRTSEAKALTSLGSVYSSLGEQQKALGYYNQALPIHRAVGDRTSEAETLHNLKDYWRSAGNSTLAIFFGKRGINLYQQLRRDIQGLDQELQQSYLKTVTHSYRELTDLLIAQGRIAEAEQVLGLLKEQEYFDYVRRAASEESAISGRATLTPDEAAADTSYNAIADKLVAIGAERGTLFAKKSRTPEEDQRMDALEKQLAVGNTEFESFLTHLGNSFNAKQQRQTLRDVRGIMEDLRELPAGTVAIHTIVGENKFTAILTTPDVQKAYTFPIKEAAFNLKVSGFRQVAVNPKLDPRPLGLELYNIIIAPMATDLRQAGAKTLMFSLDGTLRYLPLAALYDGQQYLIEQYRLSVMTLASNSRLKDKPDAQWRAAGFGVTKAFEGSSALPSVSAELSGIIAANQGDTGPLGGEIMLDEKFTQQSMRQTLRKGYPVVHIASHFQFKPGNETASFLLLGDGGRLTIAELKTSANLFGGVQLLTLSACNTGVGDGTEVEGFGTLAQRQGAKAVIASLWPVADSSTSSLMREFYRIRETSAGKTKLEAMQQAQLGLLRGTTKVDQAEGARALIHMETIGVAKPTGPPFPFDEKAPYAHPYFWAPFFLMGNWL